MIVGRADAPDSGSKPRLRIGRARAVLSGHMYSHRSGETRGLHGPRGGVQRAVRDVDEIDVVKVLPRHLAAVQVPNAVGGEPLVATVGSMLAGGFTWLKVSPAVARRTSQSAACHRSEPDQTNTSLSTGEMSEKNFS